jgi:hypothetical protein
VGLDDGLLQANGVLEHLANRLKVGRELFLLEEELLHGQV